MNYFWSAPRSWLAALVATLFASTLAACGGGGVRFDDGANQAGSQQLANTFAATLDAEGTFPPSTSAGLGAATVVVDPDSRETVAVVTTTGVSGVTVTLREGAPGVVGPIMLPLVESPAGSGVWTATAALSDDQLRALRSGDLYVQVSNFNFPEGALRGQVVPQSVFAAIPAPGGFTSGGSPLDGGAAGVPAQGFGTGANAPASFVAALRGEHAVPPTPSVALGSGSIVVDPVSRRVTAAIAGSGIAATSAALIRAGPDAETADVLALAEGAQGSGVWLARGLLSAEEYAALAAGELAFVMRSAAYPDGEIRGRLIAQQQAARFGEPVPAAGVPQPGFGAVPSPFTDVGPGIGVGVPGIGAVTGGFDSPITGAGGIGSPGIGVPSAGVGGGTGTIGTVIPGSVGTVIPGSVGTVIPGSIGTVTPGSVGTVIPGSAATVTPGSIGMTGGGFTTPGSIGLDTGADPFGTSAGLSAINGTAPSGLAPDPDLALEPVPAGSSLLF